jgi:hypothetical protein
MDPAKSKFDPGPGPESETRTYEATSDGSSTLTIQRTNLGLSVPAHSSTLKYDGKPYPIYGEPYYDSFAITRVDPLHAKSTFMQDGKTVGEAIGIVSKDGKVLTVTSTLTTPSGTKLYGVAVYDRAFAGTPAQTLTPDVVERIAHIGDESVPIRITRVPSSRNVAVEYKDDGRSPGFFAPLAAAARAGDDMAALYLWEQTVPCYGLPTTPAKQREWLDNLKDNYALTGGHGRTLEQEVTEAEARFRRCEGITESSFNEARALLRDAADHGTDPYVMSFYATYDYPADNPADARERLAALWNEGHLSALDGLGRSNSLAHRIAYNAALVALLEGKGRPDDPNLAVFRANAERLRDDTSPSAYDEAAKKAVELLRSPNCCIIP